MSAPSERIPLCVPEIRGNEWKYIKDCLDTNFVSSVGAYVDRFERVLAQASGTAHAVATVNGTSALHIALLVAGVEPDDEVLVSNVTFIAPVNAIRYANAWPVPIDAESQHWQMDVECVKEFLERSCERRGERLINRDTGRRVRAIMPVHILGHPVDMDPLLELARRFDLRVIEDATESLGARYKGRPVGSLGDAACFSFNGNKLITTGAGGMYVTNRSDWAARAKYLTTQAKDDPLEFVHGAVGYNYRLSNVHAALGIAQMEDLAARIETKRHIARRYTEAFADLAGVEVMRAAPGVDSAFWLFTVLIDEATAGISSRAKLRALAQAGIDTRPLWQPMHLSPVHQAQARGAYPVSDRLYAQGLSLPCSVGLTDAQQDRVIAAFREGIRRRS